MNRILLAYCRDNAAYAHTIDQRLRRIGIPFEHITNQPEAVPGQMAEQLRTLEEPVLLIVTDNFLKDRACMAGILPVFQTLVRQQRVFAIVTDGRATDEDRAVPTHIDRMVNALQYMNYWQNAWLALSTQHQIAEGPERAALEPELDAVRNIANEMGDFISALRESGYVEQPQFEAQDYAIFFQKFGLPEWHEQYRRLAAYDLASPAETIALAHLSTPVVGGLLTPVPVEIEVVPPPITPEYTLPEPLPEIDHLLQEMTLEEELGAEPLSEPAILTPAYPEETAILETEAPIDHTAEIEQTIADAYFWLERGHPQRGLDLLEAAAAQHPDSAQLQTAYATAHEKYAPPESLPTPPPLPEVSDAPEPMKEDAQSFDLMGDMAAEKGDYLFAKYCWDRVAELEPTYPGLFRKLGIATSENLPDYRETAVHYLQRALEQDPNDAVIYLQLARHSLYNGDNALATRHYSRAVELNPALRTPEDDRQFLPAPPPPPVVVATPQETPPPAPVIPEPVAAPIAPAREVLTVLVTGATSGIGRATAEIFARNGHRLMITGRRTERLSEVKRYFENEYRSEVLMLPFDVRDQHTVAQVIENLPESWQDIDILVNNAGLAKGLAPIHEGNIDHWDTMIDTNIKGLLYVTRAVAPGMVRRRRGHIINIGSTAGKEVYPNGNVYSASKFAVDALTRSIRLDLHKYNIRVSQVSPGHVEETEFAINRFDGDAERARIYDDFQPLRAADVAEVIYFITTRPAHVNIQDVLLMSTQQASATVVDRSGR